MTARLIPALLLAIAFATQSFAEDKLKGCKCPVSGAPVVPVAIVGAEEIHPLIARWEWLARQIGLPYFPVTPTFPWLGPLGAVPLPTKWTIQFGEPIPTDGYPPEAAEDPMLMFNLTDQVREQIQHTLYKLLVQRRSVFF